MPVLPVLCVHVFGLYILIITPNIQKHMPIAIIYQPNTVLPTFEPARVQWYWNQPNWHGQQKILSHAPAASAHPC